MTIGQYVSQHTDRSECKCGRCIDVGSKPDPEAAHTADMVFFKAVQKGEADAEEFQRLTRQHRGEFGECDPLDGKEHSYLELGGWIGDQGQALLFMALGSLLGVFDLRTPRTVLPPGSIDENLVMDLAGRGYITVIAKMNSQLEVPA